MKDFKEVPQTTPESNETVAMAHDKPGLAHTYLP